MNKKLLRIILAILIILLVSPMINALGITPGRTTMDFSPNIQSLESEVAFTVVNTDNKDMNVAFTIEGELKDYITLSNEIAHFSKNEKQKTFKYKTRLSGNEGLTPGLHTANIVAVELPENVDDPGMVVKATVSVVTQLYVFVLYPGKHLEANLDIVDKDDKVYFYIPLISRGNETIEKIKADLVIYENGKKIESLTTNEVSLESSEKKELSTVWMNPKQGHYKATAKVTYDGKTETLEKEFAIGEDLEVIGISVDDFQLGEIAKVKILVQNKLEKTIKEAFANLQVYDSKLEKISDLNSEHYEIPAKTNKEMVVYWDTENLEKGFYDSELKINYEDNFINKNFKIEVSENSMVFKGVGFAIASERTGKPGIYTLLFIIIGVLVLINLAWIIWWLRKKSKFKHSKK
jgi:predicted DNA-binding protein YlxM (UPF0122 family)